MTADQTSAFGALLRQYREAVGLTQEALADRARLSVRGVSDLERGARRVPHRQTVRLLADALALGSAERASLEGAVRRQQGPPTAGRSPSAALGSRLPVPLTSFVGRQRELTEVRCLLNGTRLLTLTGVGGIGKTRLALEAAGRLDDVPDGTWLVELAALTDATLVPQAVAAVLGVHETAGQPLLDSLIDRLRAATALLLLDNCEHLVAACAALAETLLRACPQLRILATSREMLGSTGETVWHVPALSVPEAQVGAPPVRRASTMDGAAVQAAVDQLASLLRSEAIQLFTERARVARPSFTLTADSAAAVAHICRRVDGMPLAIELAAARVRVLTPHQIAERLDDRFRLLTGGTRTAAPRQQTLRAAMDWSYDLLSEPEQAMLRALSVFAGGFTLEAAEAVCAGADGDDRSSVVATDVLDLLARLVDQSLVIAEEHGEAARYRLLETVRQYAEEKLTAAGEAGATRERHALWCLSFAEQAASHGTGPEQDIWLERLVVEHDNLRAALDWYLARDPETGLRLATALRRLWYRRGYYAECRHWLDALLARAPEATILRARALYVLAEMARIGGDYDRARALFEAALALYRELGEEHYVAWTLDNLGLIAMLQADYARARTLLEQALARFRRLGHRRAIAWLLDDLGNLARLEGGYDRARTLFEESLRILREAHDPWGIPWVLNDLANLARLKGDHDEARALLDTALRGFQEIGEPRGIASGLSLAGVLEVRRGDRRRGVRLIGAGVALHRRLVSAPQPDEQVDCDASLAAARDALGEPAFAQAWAEGQALSLEEATAEALADAAPA